jgi:HAD superfamily phosphatase (TIGR01668 family)
MTSFVQTLIPDLIVDSVVDLDFSHVPLKKVRHVVLDVDHTLMMRRGAMIDQPIKEFLIDLKRRRVIDTLFLASNSRRDLSYIASEIGAVVVPTKSYVFKPRGAYFRHLLRAIDAEPAQVVMVGDRMLTDILGGNRAGMVTILVSPIGPDSFISRLLLRRPFGRWYLRHFGNKKK